MNPSRPNPFRSRSRLLLIAACSSLVACQPAGESEEASEGPADEPVLNLPAVPLPAAPLSRAELLMAVARAASASAAGVSDLERQRQLDGRRFEVRIRFGCRGPSPDLAEATFGWSIDQERNTLRVRATPTISTDDPIVGEIAGEEFEAAEGFWIPRPWLLEPVCPAAAAVRPAPGPGDPQTEEDGATQFAAQPGDQAEDASAADDRQETVSPPPAWPKVGIAHFFRSTDPRTRRRGTQPYETVKNLQQGTPIGSQGYNLVLSGRLRALPNGGVITCVNKGAEAPPDCIVTADLDRVWIERPENREIVAEWGSG